MKIDLCINCGWCCKQGSCGFSEYDCDKKQCTSLIKKEDGYFCGKYESIIKDPTYIKENKMEKTKAYYSCNFCPKKVELNDTELKLWILNFEQRPGTTMCPNCSSKTKNLDKIKLKLYNPIYR